MANLEYQWLSALLCYPEAELIAALPEFQHCVRSGPERHHPHQAARACLGHAGPVCRRHVHRSGGVAPDRADGKGESADLSTCARPGEKRPQTTSLVRMWHPTLAPFDEA